MDVSFSWLWNMEDWGLLRRGCALITFKKKTSCLMIFLGTAKIFTTNMSSLSMKYGFPNALLRKVIPVPPGA